MVLYHDVDFSRILLSANIRVEIILLKEKNEMNYSFPFLCFIYLPCIMRIKATSTILSFLRIVFPLKRCIDAMFIIKRINIKLQNAMLFFISVTLRLGFTHF